MMLDELRRTAEARGIATSYTDAGGRHSEVPEATVRAALDPLWKADADVRSVLGGVCSKIQPLLGK